MREMRIQNQLLPHCCRHHTFPALGPGSGTQDPFQHSGHCSTVTWEGVLLASWREEMLPNSPDLTGQAPPTKDHSDQMSTALGRPSVP